MPGRRAVGKQKEMQIGKLSHVSEIRNLKMTRRPSVNLIYTVGILLYISYVPSFLFLSGFLFLLQVKAAV